MTPVRPMRAWRTWDQPPLGPSRKRKTRPPARGAAGLSETRTVPPLREARRSGLTRSSRSVASPAYAIRYLVVIFGATLNRHRPPAGLIVATVAYAAASAGRALTTTAPP